MAAQGADDVLDSEAAGRGLVGVDPDPHGIVAGAAGGDVAHARQAQQAVVHLQGRIVGDVLRIQGVVGRVKMDGQEHVRGALAHRDAGGLDLLGQVRQGGGDPVLHQDLGLIEIGPQPEGDGDGHVTVAGGLRGHVEHVLHAVDLLLDGGGDGLGDRLGRGAGIGGVHRHRRRRDLGVLGDRQTGIGDQPDQGDEDGDHRREHRPVDKEVGQLH